MPNDADPQLLDDPAWHALTGPHQRFAVPSQHGTPRAYRYRLDVSPFAAVSDATDPEAWQQLGELCGPNGRAALEAQDMIAAPDGWEMSNLFTLAQMIAPARGFSADASPEPIVALGKRNADEMLALAELTRPGPFLPSTVELGGYLGVRREGRLVAMAGRRLQVPGWIEISAVCTHPDHRGQGLSRLLMAAVDTAIRAEGQRAFLHVLHENTSAIALYRRLGFTTRADMTITVVRPTG